MSLQSLSCQMRRHDIGTFSQKQSSKRYGLAIGRTLFLRIAAADSHFLMRNTLGIVCQGFASFKYSYVGG